MYLWKEGEAKEDRFKTIGGKIKRANPTDEMIFVAKVRVNKRKVTKAKVMKGKSVKRKIIKMRYVTHQQLEEEKKNRVKAKDLNG